MFLLVTFFSLLVTYLTIFIYRTTTYFKNAGIPHQSPWPFFGNVAPVIFRKTHIVEKVTELYKRWPEAKYIGCYDCINPVIVLRDIELIKSIGVKNFANFRNHRFFVDDNNDPLLGKTMFNIKDSKWREIRNLLTPAFTGRKMRIMFDEITVCAKQFSKYINTKVEQGEDEIEFKSAFTKCASDIIAICSLGMPVNSTLDPNNDFYKYGKSAFTFNTWQLTKWYLIRFFPYLCRRLKVRLFDPKGTDYFVNLIEDTIEFRQKNGITRPDMLQLMMEQPETSPNKMDITEISAQAFFFVFAGFDTSAALMSLTALALALYPGVQDRLLDEIDEVMKKRKGNPTYEDINGMFYLEAVINETLRFYPIVGNFDRVCSEPFELPPALPGLEPFVVQPGTHVWFPSYAIHTDPKYYDNPEVFNPDRFFGKKMGTNLSTFLPFGIGSRSCIGNRFTMLETKLTLFHLLTKFRFEKSLKLRLPVEFEKFAFNFIAEIEGGYWLKVASR